MGTHFYYQDRYLFSEKVNLLEFASQNKTPFYLYSQSKIEENCKLVLEAGKSLDFLPCFALKANYNPAILKLIQSLGFGADVVSGGNYSLL